MEETGCEIMWCPNDPRCLGVDNDDDDDDVFTTEEMRPSSTDLRTSKLTYFILP